MASAAPASAPSAGVVTLIQCTASGEQSSNKRFRVQASTASDLLDFMLHRGNGNIASIIESEKGVYLAPKTCLVNEGTYEWRPIVAPDAAGAMIPRCCAPDVMPVLKLV